ncbi:MAG: FAD-dependent oxidoreductase [Bacteroidetes bacterium]|nr:FAD-dependent oxidoreductase [Bacteroidota bacterium]
MEQVVIIGNGISGITAARHIRKRSKKRITVISSESKHFYSRTALMYIFMGHMKYEHTKPYEDWFWEKNNIDLLMAQVESVDTVAGTVLLEENKSIDYDQLIVATGSVSRKLNFPGVDLKGVQTLYSLQDLEKMETNSQGISRAVIAGGGLVGVEMAEMLHSRGIQVTMLIMETRYWGNVLPKEESELITNHLRRHGINVMLNSEISQIEGNEQGTVTTVETKAGEKLDCQFVGITVGVEPNVDFLENSGIELGKGILVDDFLRTNKKNIFAVGDCSELQNPLVGRRPTEPVWYTGRMMGEVVAANICDSPTRYQPGVWFNSAKFFDVEYQTYGMVLPELPEESGSFFWQHPLGEKCIRLVYEKKSFRLTGANIFGIRVRHEVFDHWIKSEKDIFYALTNLASANFEPEFYKSYENEIINSFNDLGLGERIEPVKKKKRLLGLFS